MLTVFAKVSEAMRPFAANDFLGGRDARAIDEAVQVAEGAEREIDRGLAVVLAGHVGEGKAGGLAQLAGQGLAGSAIQVGDDDGRRLRRREAAPSPRPAPMRRR